MKKPTYKTTRKYKCPYCDFKAVRGELVEHVDKEHAELMPEGYTAARAVYDFVNGKNYNTCMICGKKVYEWNEKCGRYRNLCNDPKCREEVRRIALERHMKVYNKPTLLTDPEHQEKMLANRKISGMYKFSDGGSCSYTGTYEKKALEFMDKVMEIPSYDIQSPGPILEYEYNGKIHHWIVDFLYIPGNLLIEVKDGGSNPNNRTMTTYREKQVAKETMITNLGTFNYIRLTNNQFEQLLAVLADMKNEALTNENPKATIHINEEVGGLPMANRAPEAYIIPYGMNNVFSGFAYGDSEDDRIVYPDNDKLSNMDKAEFKKKFDTGHYLYYTGKDKKDKITSVREAIDNNNINPSPYCFVEMIVGERFHGLNEIFECELFRYTSNDVEKKIASFIENAIVVSAENSSIKDRNVVDSVGHVFICRSPKGYYAITPEDFYMASPYFSTVEDLKMSQVVDLLNNIYKKNSKNINSVEED